MESLLYRFLAEGEMPGISVCGAVAAFLRFSLLERMSNNQTIKIPINVPTVASQKRRIPFIQGGRSGDSLETIRMTIKVIVGIFPSFGILKNIQIRSRIKTETNMPIKENGNNVRYRYAKEAPKKVPNIRSHPFCMEFFIPGCCMTTIAEVQVNNEPARLESL